MRTEAENIFLGKNKKKWEKVGKCGRKYVTLNPYFTLIYVRMRFLGNIEAKTDSKGRAFLPSAFRKVLQASNEERLVLKKNPFEQCLVLYPESVWNKQLDALRAHLNRWNARHQQIFRTFVSNVELINLDSNGRFLIPKRYSKKINLGQNITFIGVDDTIEIWGDLEEGNPFMEPEEFREALQDIMSNITKNSEDSKQGDL